MNDMTSLLTIAAAISVIGAALAALWRWVLQPAARVVKALLLFFEDWFGEPSRPGFVGRRGVMERLDLLEHRAQRTEWHVGNGNPEPLRAVVERLDKRVEDVETIVDPNL